jgi:hypothetical protein
VRCLPTLRADRDWFQRGFRLTPVARAMVGLADTEPEGCTMLWTYARAGGGSDGRGGHGTCAATRRLALAGIALGAAAGLALAPVMTVSAVSAHAATAAPHARLAPCPCTNPVCQSGC